MKGRKMDLSDHDAGGGGRDKRVRADELGNGACGCNDAWLLNSHRN